MAYSLYTAGYSGLKMTELDDTVQYLNAKLVDIRFSPWSRSATWQQAAFQQVFGDRYLHLKALGNKNYKQQYGEGVMLADVEEGTFRLARVLQHQNAIILCACAEHTTCHRRTVAQEMVSRYGVEVVHLSIEDIRKYGSPPKAIQLPLF